MFTKTKTITERQLKNGRSIKETTTLGWSRRRKRKGKKCGSNKKVSWLRKELSELNASFIEATLNFYFAGLVIAKVTPMLSLALPFLGAFPWVTTAVSAACIGFVAFIFGALLMSYTRRILVWGAGKLKGIFSRK